VIAPYSECEIVVGEARNTPEVPSAFKIACDFFGLGSSIGNMIDAPIVSFKIACIDRIYLVSEISSMVVKGRGLFTHF